MEEKRRFFLAVIFKKVEENRGNENERERRKGEK